MSDSEYDENITMEDIVKDITEEEFLNNKDTREILDTEHYFEYDTYMSKKIERIFDAYYDQFNCKEVFSSRDAKYCSLAFSSLVYNYIVKEYDFKLFIDCPELAAPIFKEKAE